MAVGVEGKGSGVVAEIALHCFYIIPTVQSVDGVGMPQIVKTQIGNAQVGSYALELTVYRVKQPLI